MVLLEVGYADPFSTADGRRWRANSALLQVDPWGALQTQYVQACSGAALNYNQLSHEMRVDHTSADRRVLTDAHEGEAAAGRRAGARRVDAPKETSTWTSDAFVGVEVVAWHRDANVVSGVHDLWDVASPDEPSWDPAETTWKRLTGLRCSGAGRTPTARAGPKALDYHHVSSVSVGPSGDLIVASRNLNTIWAFDAAGARAGAAPKWTLGAPPATPTLRSTGRSTASTRRTPRSSSPTAACS